LIILIVFLGVFPKPVLDRITPSVDRLVIHVDQVTHTPIPSGLRYGAAGSPVTHSPTASALPATGGRTEAGRAPHSAEGAP
jgi:hypothetical protein